MKYLEKNDVVKSIKNFSKHKLENEKTVFTFLLVSCVSECLLFLFMYYLFCFFHEIHTESQIFIVRKEKAANN